MTIRPATPEDLPAIAALHAANWRRDYAGLVPEDRLGAPLAAFMAARWATLGPGVLVAEAAGLAGFAAFDAGAAEGLHLGNLHVAAGRRGRGVGRALMRAVALQAGPRPVWLEVLAGNGPARAVYRRWGGTEGAVFVDRILEAEVPALRVGWPSGEALARHLAEVGR